MEPSEDTAMVGDNWVRHTWRSERAPVCHQYLACGTFPSGVEVHSSNCPLHDRAKCPVCAPVCHERPGCMVPPPDIDVPGLIESHAIDCPLHDPTTCKSCR